MTTPKNTRIDTFVDRVSSLSDVFSFPSWWATRFSSKNRFHEELTKLLYFQQFEWNVRSLVKRSFRNFLLLGYYIFKTFLIKLKFRRKVSEAKKSLALDPFLLIRTFFYKNSLRENKFHDIIYQDLLPQTKKLGLKEVFIVDPLAPLDSVQGCESITIPYQYFISFFDFPKIMFWLLRDIIRCLFTKVSFVVNGKEVGPYAKALCLKDLLDMAAFENYAHYASAKRIEKVFPRPKAVLFTYENNSWERMFCFGIKRANPSSLLCGVQHSVMPEASINMYLGEAEAKKLGPLVDKVFTSGPYATELFHRHSHLEKEKFLTLGTTRFSYLFHMDSSPRETKYDFLIILEGIPESTRMVSLFLENCQRLNVRPKVLVRFHHALGYDKLRSLFERPLEDFEFVKISAETSVADDILNSKYIVYWGTTAAMEAIVLGKTVINFKKFVELDFDPLSELKENKIDWYQDQNVIELATDFEEKGPDQKEKEKNQAIKFVRDYFSPIAEIPQDFFDKMREP